MYLRFHYSRIPIKMQDAATQKTASPFPDPRFFGFQSSAFALLLRRRGRFLAFLAISLSKFSARAELWS